MFFLTKGVQEVSNFLYTACDDFYVFSIGPILVDLSLDWIFLARHIALVQSEGSDSTRRRGAPTSEPRRAAYTLYTLRAYLF